MFIDTIYLDEEVEVRVVCSLKIGRYATERNVVKQLLFLDAHHVHAHGAGDHLHAILYRLLDQALQAVDPLVAHDHPHQAAAHAHHVEFRQFELSAVGREHHAEHFAKQVFRYGWFLPFLDDVQAPEGEEEALGEALAYKGVSQFPARIKCATLAWKACEKALDDGDTDE